MTGCHEAVTKRTSATRELGYKRKTHQGCASSGKSDSVYEFYVKSHIISSLTIVALGFDNNALFAPGIRKQTVFAHVISVLTV